MDMPALHLTVVCAAQDVYTEDDEWAHMGAYQASPSVAPSVPDTVNQLVCSIAVIPSNPSTHGHVPCHRQHQLHCMAALQSAGQPPSRACWQFLWQE